MSETKRRGYRSVSVRAPIFDRLLEIAQREGLNSAAEAVEHLVNKYVEGYVLGEAASVEAMVSRLLFKDRRPGYYLYETTCMGHAADPLVFYTYRVGMNSGRPKVRLILAVSPLPVYKSYCLDPRRCEYETLAKDLDYCIDYASQKMHELLKEKQEAVEILDKMGIDTTDLKACMKDKDSCRSKAETMILVPLDKIEEARQLSLFKR
ncbi:hypothetical protein [Pyrodictium abyssi]|uniref:Ribbon-helix-helix protein CopG domain-containing protein n=1 Tax=Pyrodictium abyssi TaxID=54256 RepID=A0ABM8J049_9CREN|nr:hypothetical protein PABY_21390 [Pyrodictium abyssi]